MDELNNKNDKLVSMMAAIDALESGKDKKAKGDIGGFYNAIIQNDIEKLRNLPSAQPEIAENLHLYKCYITDKDGLQHEVIHTGDIRRVTGWEI